MGCGDILPWTRRARDATEQDGQPSTVLAIPAPIVDLVAGTNDPPPPANSITPAERRKRVVRKGMIALLTIGIAVGFFFWGRSRGESQAPSPAPTLTTLTVTKTATETATATVTETETVWEETPLETVTVTKPITRTVTVFRTTPNPTPV